MSGDVARIDRRPCWSMGCSSTTTTRIITFPFPILTKRPPVPTNIRHVTTPGRAGGLRAKEHVLDAVGSTGHRIRVRRGGRSRWCRRRRSTLRAAAITRSGSKLIMTLSAVRLCARAVSARAQDSAVKEPSLTPITAWLAVRSERSPPAVAPWSGHREPVRAAQPLAGRRRGPRTPRRTPTARSRLSMRVMSHVASRPA